MTYRLWTYILLLLILINGSMGIIMAYSPVTLNTPFSVSSHNIINGVLSIVLMFLVYKQVGLPSVSVDIMGKTTLFSPVRIE